MNENLKNQMDTAVRNIESRSQPEKIIVLVVLIAGLSLSYLSFAFDPIRAEKAASRSQITNLGRQIQTQQTTYAGMLEANQEDPNKFANDRLAVIAREQAELDQEIENLAANLITPADMTRILTSVLERQDGLKLVSFQNSAAAPLRTGISDADEQLVEEETDNIQADVSGQVFEHGLSIEFHGSYFETLEYLLYLEEITAGFFWDSITFKQLQWPEAQITLQIHTLSLNAGFIGV